MEFSARYMIAGFLVLATLIGVFGFIYWLTNSTDIGETAPYRIRFTVPVSGLSEGSDVLFNGIKIGEVTALRFDRQSPDATIAEADLSTQAPIRADTTVGIAFQGLTGAASILMTGGSNDAGPPSEAGGIPTLEAAPSASRSWTDSAGRVLGRLDNLLSENSGRFDAILGGLERLTGVGDTAKAVVFDLSVPEFPNGENKQTDWQLVVSEPTILLALNTDKVQVKQIDGSLAQFEGAQWTDNLPNLFQTKFIRAFENAGYTNSVLRPADVFEPEFRMAIDIRDFHLERDSAPRAQAELMARLIDGEGRVLGSRLFEEQLAAETDDLQGSIESLSRLFSRLSRKIVEWTLSELENSR